MAPFKTLNRYLCGDPVAGFIVKNRTMGVPFAMNARMIMTSGTVSYAPPVCPDKPRAPASAVKKTIVSRHNWMFLSKDGFLGVGQGADRGVEL